MFKIGDCVERINGPNNGMYPKQRGYITSIGDDGSINIDNRSFNHDPQNLILINKENFMDGIKKYFEKNQDIVYTIGLVLLLDYFLFGGALRSKIQATVEQALNWRNGITGNPLILT